MSPFGNTFHVVIVTVNSNTAKSSLELLRSVLAFDYVAKRPFAVVEFGHCQSDVEWMYDVMKRGGIQAPHRVVFSSRRGFAPRPFPKVSVPPNFCFVQNVQH